jgi:hypothetical protein
MSVLAPVSHKEEALRAQLLAQFREKDGGKNNVISSEDFRRVLESLGLVFGHPVVDRLMLLCTFNANGSVDLRRFAEVVELAHGNVEEDARGRARAKLHSDLSSLSQADRVRRLAKDIHVLFYKFDSGAGSLTEFRQNLAELGIRETHETKRLLRQTPVSFRELLGSLMQTTSDVPSGAAAGVSRTVSERDSERSSAGIGASSAGIGASSAGIGATERGFEDHLCVNENGLAARDTARYRQGPAPPKTPQQRAAERAKEKVLKDSDVITWGAAAGGGDDLLPPRPPGSGHGKARGEFYADRNTSHWNPTLWSSADESVADSIRNTNQHHFDTTYELAAAQGLARTEGPLTSAGYHSQDKGLVREQIYSAIRQLDSGALTSADFRERLAQIGLEMPVEAKTLLAHYEANGRVGFSDFVRAFEPYFRRSTVHSPHKEDHGHADGLSHVTDMTGRILRRGRRPKTHHDDSVHAARGHGDIIAWDPNKSDHPDHESELKRTAERRQRQKYYAESSTILNWTGSRENEGPQPRDAGAPRTTMSRSAARWAATHDRKSNIITWVGAPPAKMKPPSKLTSIYGVRAHNKPCPFGTENDVLQPGERPAVIGSRGQRLAEQSYRETGGWFDVRPDQRSTLGPNASTDGEGGAGLAYRPAIRRRTGMKSQASHIGVGFTVKEDPSFTTGRKKRRDMYVDHFEDGGVASAFQEAPARLGKKIGYEAQDRNWVKDQVVIGD